MHRPVLRILIASVIAMRLNGQVPSAPVPAVPAVDPLHQAGQNVTVSLLTMGNGANVWELFGHTAIWIHDNTTGRDSVFNWGVFDREAPHFIPHFLQGLLLYQMGGDTMDRLLYAYRYWNRSVVAQELDLTTAQKDSLLHIIQVNARPENLQYRYDYFIDNCSTRPRDILDRVLGGQLRLGADSLTATSFRWHTLRLMRADKPLTLGVDIGLGEPSDKPITKWQEMFLPKKLHDWVATRRIHDETGAERPLVKSERVLFQAARPPEFTVAPSLGGPLFTLGLLLAGLLAWLGSRTSSRGARISAAIVAGVWATTCGVLGLILSLLWGVTDHMFAHRNENLLLFNPVWLVLAVLLPVFLVSGRAGRATRDLAYLAAGLTALALLAHVIPVSRQENLPLVALTLPPALVLAWLASPKRAEAGAHDRTDAATANA